MGDTWENLKNDVLVVDGVVPKIAHEIDPKLFPTEISFTTQDSQLKRPQDEIIKEMIEIILTKSGKEYAYIVIDEVGQYIGSSNSHILDMQGLAENIKEIGEGKVWLISTAQQTLTEDDDRAALNSPELSKLQ